VKKKNNFEEDSLSNQKDNFKKYYRYNILLYKSINYEDKKDSSIYELPFQLNNKQEIFYNYRIDKSKLFDMLGGISVNKHLAEDDIIDKKKSSYRNIWIGEFSILVLERKLILNLESIPEPNKKKTFLIGWEWMKKC